MLIRLHTAILLVRRLYGKYPVRSYQIGSRVSNRCLVSSFFSPKAGSTGLVNDLPRSAAPDLRGGPRDVRSR